MRAIATRLWTIIVALAIAAAGAPAHAAPDGRPEAQVAQGRLAGTADRGLHVFRGVPYALPPIGDRRWRPPAPPAPWQGTRDASAFGASCMQPPYPADSVYFETLAAVSEDCLTLNIWAPKNARQAPVILWIHGGALQRGSSASPMYDGAEYAKRGIVFVSINYRLGVFGWFAHPALSAESPEGISGNYGLLDQIAALAWVRANIGGFGGDAAKVTVMGESAGALSATYLLASPQARGLFARAIVQSTNMRAMPALRDAAFGMPPAEAMGASLGGDIAALRALDAEALLARAVQARFPAQGTIDGKLLPAQLVDIFDRGEQAKVPVLAGFNSGEIRSQRLLVPPAPREPAAYEAEMARRYGDLAPAWLRLYPASDIGESQLAATRDAVYGWATERLVRTQAAAGLPAYLFLFDHCYAAARARDLCNFHAGELAFSFGLAGSEARLPPNWPAPARDDDRALAAAMVDYWASFAATGVPTAPGAPAWPAYGAEEAYMHFAATPVAGRDPLPGMFELQEAITARRRCAGEQWLVNVSPLAPETVQGCKHAPAP